MPPYASGFFASLTTLRTGPSIVEADPVNLAIKTTKHGRSSSSAFDNAKLDLKIRNALEGVQCSLRALIFEYLTHFGVSKASINELRAHYSANNFLRVMKLAQEYTECIIANSANNKNANYLQRKINNNNKQLSIDTLRCLIVTNWEQLCRYYVLLHKRAYCAYSRLRCQQAGENLDHGLDDYYYHLQNHNKLPYNHGNNNNNNSNTSKSYNDDSKPVNSLGSNFIARQQRQHQRYLLGKETKKALDLQVKLAEASCTFQKEYILAQKWESQFATVTAVAVKVDENIRINNNNKQQ